MTKQTKPVELTDSLDIEIAVDKFLTEKGIEFSYVQNPSGLDGEQLYRALVYNLKRPYDTEEEGMPIQFTLRFSRKDRVLFETSYGQGIAYAPRTCYSQGMYGTAENVRKNGVAFDKLLAWINRSRQGGRDLMKLTGFHFTHDFLYVSDFSELATRSHRSGVNTAEAIAKEKGVKAARQFLSRQGYGEGVSAADALSCLLMDARAAETTFEDWAAEFGYDTDSRKAEAVYRACDEIGKKLKSLLSASDIDHLSNLVQNY